MTTPLEHALPFVAGLALCAIRWLPTIVLVPVFAGHALGALARAVVMLALALPVAPSVAAAFAHAPPTLGEALVLACKEAMLGCLLAGLIGVPFWAIEAAGGYIDYQRGGNPQALDPAMFVETSVFGMLLRQASIVYLMHSGGLHALLQVVAVSHTVWPTLAEHPTLGRDAWAPLGALLVATMRFSLTLAAPYLLALAAVEACFAILSRVNAKFPAYLAALPFKSVVLVLLIALTLPRLLTAAADVAREHGEDVRDTLQESMLSGAPRVTALAVRNRSEPERPAR